MTDTPRNDSELGQLSAEPEKPRPAQTSSKPRYFSTLTRHAAQRSVQRTGLGPGALEQMLANGQHFWAQSPIPGKTGYPLVYDATTGDYFVGVLSADDQRLLTVLTLAQFERTLGAPVPPVRLGLARLALIKPTQTEQPVEDEEPKGGVLAKPFVTHEQPLWRVVLVSVEGVEHEILSALHSAICSRFLFVRQPDTEVEFTRRARRVAKSYAFSRWVASRRPRGLEPESVSAVHAVCCDSKGVVLYRCDVTQALCEGLASSEFDRTQQELLKKARASRVLSRQQAEERKYARRQAREAERQRQLATQAKAGSTSEVILHSR